MKTTRKVLALLLALMMTAALCATAFADGGTCTITVNKAKENETYKLYKLFDLSVDDPSAPTAFTYTVTTEWKDFFKTGAGAAYVDVAESGTVTPKEGFIDAAALAVSASAALDGKTVASTQTATGNTVEFSGLDNGYYLITSSLGTLAMIETTPQSSAVTIEDKNPEDTIEKSVKEDSTGSYGATNDAEIGQQVEFKSIATIEPHTRNVKIHDTMGDGLTFTDGSIKIYVGTEVNESNLLAADNYEILGTPENSDTFTIVIKDEYIATLTAETKLTLTYTATLNGSAVTFTSSSETGETVWRYTINAQENKTVITYGDQQSVESKTSTTTHKLEILKYANGDKSKRLAGAKFQLKNAAGDVVKLSAMQDSANYRVDPNGNVDTFTTVAGQNIVIWGLDADTYTLVEVEAPDGYNKANDVTVTVSNQDNTVAEVENKAGNTLPSTGGMGTTIFYVVGSILVIGAVVLLVSKKRMNTAE
ncbi:MAG: SpaA isopeptide-forming pilin-related protein [Firmicutes bacterium]|nr:SpaA isopeptide-forming pilin-related protein [Bacillota bacterium]MDY6159433.1 SpaA isopeptide-forming pilin-related protein [Candidatus Faecousia sp.]